MHRPLVVGIGASAGGLEAFQEFLAALSNAPGLALVYVQHPEPNNESPLAERLSAVTAMKTVQITRRTRIAADTLYICPPQTRIEIRNGFLQTFDKSDDRRPTPIDHFFHSLSENEGYRGVGIILSGIGTDGTLGLKAISDGGGLTFAQDPESALFDSMPRSAATTGSADYVLPPAEMAGELRRYIDYLSPFAKQLQKKSLFDRVEQEIPDIVEQLLRDTRHDFRHYKTSTLSRRIQRRMQVLRIPNVGRYIGASNATGKSLSNCFRNC